MTVNVEARLHAAHGMLTSLHDGHHAWHADVETDAGPAEAPSPHALLASALAACTALTLQLYANRHGIGVAGCSVKVNHEALPASNGQSATRLTRSIVLDGEISEDQRVRLLSAAERCPIHRLLTGRVEIVAAPDRALGFTHADAAR